MEKFVKILGTVIVLALSGMFVIRCVVAADKSAFSSPEATQNWCEAYSDGESLTYTVKISAEMSTDGYFSAYGFYYNTESGEAQLAERWNDSVYGYTDMEEGHEFEFFLRNDTTGEEFTAVTVDSVEKWMYNYRRLLIEGVSAGENDQISAVMKLRDGFESTQVIKYDEQEFSVYKPSRKLLKQMSERR